MKNSLLLVLLIGLTFSLQAQNSARDEQARKVTAELTKLYTLNKRQADEMLKIQTRYFKNQEEIAPFKTSNPSLYDQKIISNRFGTDASMRRLLNPEQIRKFDQAQKDKRIRIGSKMNEMQKNGASQQEINQMRIQMQAE